jgi:hypothetical protein
MPEERNALISKQPPSRHESLSHAFVPDWQMPCLEGETDALSHPPRISKMDKQLSSFPNGRVDDQSGVYLAEG